MKLTIDQIQKVFLGLGVAEPVEIVNTEDEANKDFNPDSFISEFINSKEEVFNAKYNETILPQKLKEVAGEFGGKLNGYIRKASNNQIPLSELQNLQDSEKISKLVEILDTNKGKDTEALRNQLTNAINEHTQEIERIKEENKKELLKANNKLNDFKITDYLEKTILPNIPLVDGDNKIRTNLLKSTLMNEFNLVYNDEKGVVDVRKKDDINLPVISKDNNLLKIEDFATDFFKGLGVVKIDNRHEKTSSDKEYMVNKQNINNAGFNGIDSKTLESLQNI